MIGLLFFYSCAPNRSLTESPRTNIFRSEDYIIYQLQQNQTPAELSQKFLGAKRKSWIIEEYVILSDRLYVKMPFNGLLN